MQDDVLAVQRFFMALAEDDIHVIGSNIVCLILQNTVQGFLCYLYNCRLLTCRRIDCSHKHYLIFK